MSAAMLTADWFLLGRDLYFRKFEIYNMGWRNEVNMDNIVMAAAPYGGPIATKRDENKIVKGSGQPIISIYSGSGKQMASIKWVRRPIVKMGWSNEEKFICIQTDGNVVLHDLFGNFLHLFSIGQEAQDTKVIDARIFTSMQNTTGIAVMTSTFKIFLINNILDPKKRQLSELPRSNLHPTSWAVISEERHSEVLIARERELYRLTQDEHHTSTMLEPDIAHKYTSILEISVSINARHVALFTDAGYLWMGSSDLRTIYCEIDTNIFFKPKQLVWCGSEAVVAFWEKNCHLLIVGRHGEQFSYYYDSCVNLVSEIDGVRILSNSQHELIQKVPDVVQKIFRINSTEPGSFLLEASKQFQRNNHRADEYICLVKDNLNKAVEQCIEASGYEFDTEVQKNLIRAAQFGKCFVPTINSDEYVQMCRVLRVLNAIRDRKIGIPLTFTELHYLGHKTLLDRLVARHHYFLAIEIAKYLKMPHADGMGRILVHWAKYKVGQPLLDEETVAREIANKLGYTPGISYSDIAGTAANSGRKKLAIKLLDYELKASKQVQLLLKLDKNQSALEKAIESGITDLVYMVILQLRDNMPLGDFKMTIRKFPVALALYIKYCRMHNMQALNEMHIQEDNHNSQAYNHILECINDKNVYMRDSSLQAASSAYKNARNDVCSAICDETLQLLKLQRTLEDKFKNERFVGLSVHDTCKALLKMNELKLADKMKADFKIPEKRYWWMRIESYAENKEFEELEKFSKVKKSPIGYAPFVDVCLKIIDGGREEALKYLPKVADDIKVKYYVKAKYLDTAADIAFEQKDMQALLQVQNKTDKQSSLYGKINDLISQLGARK